MKEKPDRAARLAVVIPALDEAATIGGIVAECRALPFVAETIVVDDGSADATAALAAETGARVLRHERNRGKGASLWDGMAAAVADGADLVATLDGDGQHRPADLGRVFACACACQGRIVIGSRRSGRRDAPRARYAANRVADFWISWAARHPIEDSQSGFRIYPAPLLRALLARPKLADGFAFESEILIEAARLGVETASVDIPTIYGAGLRPSYFRPVADIGSIVAMVAGKLLRRGMDPAGLWRSLRHPAVDGNRLAGDVARPVRR